MRLRAALLLAAFSASLMARPSPADEALLQAEKLLGQKKYAEAETSLREILRNDPSNARAHGNLALALLSQAKTREAIDEGRLAAAFGPEAAEARYIYGLALSAGGRPLEAAREFEKAVAGTPGTAGPLAALADAYARAGDPRAAAAYEKLITLEPGRLDHRAALAEHLWRAEKTGDAGNRVIEGAIQAFPASADLPLRYGRALIEQDRYLDGAARLEASRKLGGEGEALALLLGSAYRQADRVDEAEPVLAAAAAEYPASPDSRGDYGRLLLQGGRAAEARPELEAAARLAPKSASLQLELGRAYETLGQLDQAETAYRRAATLAPSLPHPHDALGRLLLLRKKRKEAKAELATQRRLEERGSQRAAETTALVEKADALSRLGRHKAALRTLEKAREMDPASRRIPLRLSVERSRAADATR